jgi:hypothetical protein
MARFMIENRKGFVEMIKRLVLDVYNLWPWIPQAHRLSSRYSVRWQISSSDLLDYIIKFPSILDKEPQKQWVGRSNRPRDASDTRLRLLTHCTTRKGR